MKILPIFSCTPVPKTKFPYVNRSEIEYVTRHYSHVSSQYKKFFQSYYLLYWSPYYFCEQLQHGCILHNSVKYTVVYADNRDPHWYKRYHTQIKLSFRKPDSVFNIHPVVLVSGA